MNNTRNDDIAPDALWLKLAEPRPSEVVDFPRKDANGQPIGQIRIQVLPEDKHDVARLEAHTKLRRKVERLGQKYNPEDMHGAAMREVLGDMIAKELLCMSVLSNTPMKGSEDSASPSYPFLFRDADDIGNKLSADEVLVLFNAYLQTQHKYGPFAGNLPPDEVEAWIQRLQEGAAAFPLHQVSLPRLVELTSLLAARLSSLSRILRSQWESLPDSLKSDLEIFCLDTSYSGEQPDESTLDYSERLPDVTLETAVKAAQEAKIGRDR